MTVPTTFRLRVGDEWFSCTSQKWETIDEIVHDLKTIAKEDPEVWMRVRKDGIEQMIRWSQVKQIRLGGTKPDWSK